MAVSENPNEQQKPAENEISDYFEGVKKLEMQGHESGIRKARTALFVTAALFLIGEILSATASGAEMTPLFIGIVVVEVGIFVALALWTKTRPFAAIIIGLILFILLWILAIVVVGGEAAYKGIVIKIIVIGVLVSALKPAKAWEDLKKSS